MPILTSDSRFPWMICEQVSTACWAALTFTHAAQSWARVRGAGVGAVVGADGAVADAVWVGATAAPLGAGVFCAHAACAVSASADAANANALRITRLRWRDSAANRKTASAKCFDYRFARIARADSRSAGLSTPFGKSEIASAKMLM